MQEGYLYPGLWLEDALCPSDAGTAVLLGGIVMKVGTAWKPVGILLCGVLDFGDLGK